MRQLEQLQQYVSDWNEDFMLANLAHEQLDIQLENHHEQGKPYPDIKEIQVVLDLWVLETRSKLVMDTLIQE